MKKLLALGLLVNVIYVVGLVCVVFWFYGHVLVPTFHLPPIQIR